MLSHGKGCARTGLVLSLLCATTLPWSRAEADSGPSGGGYHDQSAAPNYRESAPYLAGGDSDGVRTYRGMTMIDEGSTLTLLDAASAPGEILDDGRLVVRNSGGPLTLASIAGSGSLVQEGPGTTTLTGRSTYTGATVVSAGRLALAAGSTGIASSASVTVTGGVLDLTAVDDQLLRTLAEGPRGGLSLAVGAEPAVTVAGAVTLAGAVEITLRADAPAGRPLTLIHTSGSQGVTGTFAGLPEGATVGFDGSDYRITYTGAGGHDVALIPAASAAPAGFAGTTAATTRPATPTAGATIFLKPERAAGDGTDPLPSTLVLAFALAVVGPVTSLALLLRRRRTATVGRRHRGVRR